MSEPLDLDPSAEDQVAALTRQLGALVSACRRWWTDVKDQPADWEENANTLVLGLACRELFGDTDLAGPAIQVLPWKQTDPPPVEQIQHALRLIGGRPIHLYAVSVDSGTWGVVLADQPLDLIQIATAHDDARRTGRLDSEL